MADSPDFEDADSLDALLASDPLREAVGAMRGYEWQRWLTAKAWLALGAAGAVWIEWGEDLTVWDADGVRTIQAKDQARPVSLGDAKMRAMISRAFTAPAGVQTLLWTSAKPGLERGAPFRRPGVEAWADAVADGEVGALRDYLANDGVLTSEAQAVVAEADEQAFRALLARVSWITGASDLAGLRVEVQQAVEARMTTLVGYAGISIRGSSLTARLLTQVGEVGVREVRNQRVLRAGELDRLLMQDQAEAFAGSLPVMQAVQARETGADAGRKLLERVADIRRHVGFPNGSAGPFDDWIRLADELLGGKYDGAPAPDRLEALARAAWGLADPALGTRGRELFAAASELGRSETLRLAEIAIDSYRDLPEALMKLRDDRSPEAVSLTLIMLSRQADWDAALDWAQGRPASAFASIGAYHVLFQLELAGRWAEALAFSEGISAAQKAERPILHALRGFALMAEVMQPEHRIDLLSHPVPVDPAEIRDRFDPTSSRLTSALAAAAAEFREASLALRSLNPPALEQAAVHDDLSLWLDLENPARRLAALAMLRQRLVTGEEFSRTIAFAIAYGLDVDLEGARRAFEARIALGGLDNQDFRALLTLYQEPTARLALFARFWDAVTRFAGEAHATALRIEALFRSGRLDETEAALASAFAEHPDDPNLRRLQAILLGERGEATSPRMREIWEETGETTDLRNLCAALVREKRWPTVGDAAATLAERTRADGDLAWACEAYVRAGLPSRALEVMASFPIEMARSAALRQRQVGLLIEQGRFAEPRPILDALLSDPDRDDPDDERLLLSLGIECGDWEVAMAYVERLWVRRDRRSPRHLVEAAALAFDRGQEARARELANAATAKETNDARTFFTAWMIAHAADRELDWPEAATWFERAGALSGPNGPLQTASREQVAEFLPAQARQRSETASRLQRAEAPLFVVGEALQAPLSDMILGSALRNTREPDPRQRWPIPTIRGGRPPAPLTEVQSVAIDLTTLMVLHTARALPAILRRFRLVLPHGTLHALFADHQWMRLFSPQRAAAAQEILRLVAEERLVPTPLAKSRDTALIAEVGEDLADLLDHARTNGVRAVIPAPVQRPGWLVREVADMSAHLPVLASVPDLAKAAHRAGRVSAAALETAQRRLGSFDRQWDGAPPVSAREKVIVSELGLRYLELSNLLLPVIEAFRTLAVPVSTVARAREDAARGRSAAEVLQQVDELRAHLRDGIASGRVTVAPVPAEEARDERHPTLRLLQVSGVDAYALDDRAVNHVVTHVTPEGPRPMITSLDMIEELGNAETVTWGEVRDAATTLMRATFLFLPITPNRLMKELAAAVSDGAFHETLELRAIAEYVGRLMLLNRSVLPTEAIYFENLNQVCLRALRVWWVEAPTVAAAQAGANWIWNLMPDPRDAPPIWTPETTFESGDDVYVRQVAEVAFPWPVPIERQEAMRTWVEEVIAAPLNEVRPDLLQRVAALIAERMARIDRGGDFGDA